jgi:hypothetical protein
MGDDALLLRLGDVGGDGLRIDRGWIDIEAVSRLQQFPDEKADGKRDRRDRLEIDQCLQPDPADAFEVAHRGDAMHHRAEDHGRYHHLDQRNEAVAKRLQFLAEIGKEITDQDSERDRDQDLDVENPIPGLMAAMAGRLDGI